ncbi:MAG TPA: DotU family type IV/VI secretion system protein [Gemmatirosa sp.]
MAASSPATFPAAGAPAAGAPAVGTGRLAAAFQEVFTAIARLRTDRQPVQDGAAFRAHMLDLLTRADGDARGAGYDPADVRLAGFAAVALLDESALNARQPALADWARRPLQEELFGNHLAGEWFYQHVEQLLARPDSPQLADVLEVHQLCLLMGFRGRYGSHDAGAVHAVASRIAERIARLRGPAGDLVPGWRPPDDAVVVRDPWVRRLTIGVAAAAVFAGAIWGAAALSVGTAAADVRSLGVGPGTLP